MNIKIKILLVEHDINDVELLQYELKKSGIDYESVVVENEVDYRHALKNFIPDIILSDYSLPSFDGDTAFKISQQMTPDTPFIFVSGTIGEEISIEYIKNGVTDYALKDKLFTLPIKIKRALKEANEKLEKRITEASLLQSEANLHSIFETTDVGLLLMDIDFNVVACNATIGRWSKNTFGTSLAKGMNLRKLLLPESLGEFDVMMGIILQGGKVDYETEYPDVDNDLYCFLMNGKPIIDKENKVIGVCLSVNDITARKQAENQIIKLNAGLEEIVRARTSELVDANTALEAYSYSVSHDLHAPLRSILGFTKIIQNRYEPSFSTELKELFGYIESNGRRMSDIIDDLLTLAKIGKQKPKLTVVNMNNLVVKVWNNICFSSPNTAIFETVDLPTIRADISMIEQVLINLLSNAIKYSSKQNKSVIKLGYKNEAGTNVFFIKDNGVGFDMKNYDKLFKVFHRLHSVSEFEGTGIGLFLVKLILDKHEGMVWAESKLGEGATFYFSIQD